MKILNPRIFQIKFLLLLLVILSPAVQSVSVKAADVRVEVVPPRSAYVNAEFAVEVKVYQSSTAEVIDFDIPGLVVTGQSSSRSIQIIQGNMSSQNSFSYRCFADRTGEITIPSIKVRVDEGKIYSSEPVKFMVSDVPQSPVSGSSAPRGRPRNDDAVIVDVSVNPEKLYVGQQGLLDIDILIHQSLWGRPQYTPPQLENTSSERLGDIQNLPPVNYGGVNYNRNLERRVFFPNTTGDLIIHPARVNYSVDGFWGSTRTASSRAGKIEVLPLPSSGRPADFSGLVGENFEILAELDSIKVVAGEPVNLKLTVSGPVLPAMISRPQLEFEGKFELYDSGSSSSILNAGELLTGRKVFDVILIFRKSGDYKDGKAWFNYFCPETGRYKVAEALFPELKILPSEEQVPTTVDLSNTGIQPVPGQENRFGESYNQEPAYIITSLPRYGRFRPVKLSGFKSMGCLLVSILIIATGWVIKRYRKYLDSNPEYRRRRQAKIIYRKSVKELRRSRRTDQIIRYFINYLQLSLEVETVETGNRELIAVLEEKGLPAELQQRIRRFVDQLESFNYGGGEVSFEKAFDDYQSLVVDIEKFINEMWA